eukprot:365175-Chlamydomonas_euryale.AAC.5
MQAGQLRHTAGSGLRGGSKASCIWLPSAEAASGCAHGHQRAIGGRRCYSLLAVHVASQGAAQ